MPTNQGHPEQYTAPAIGPEGESPAVASSQIHADDQSTAQGQETTGDAGSTPQSGSESSSGPGKELVLASDATVERVSQAKEVVKHASQRTSRATVQVTVRAAKGSGRAVFAPAPATWRYLGRFASGAPMSGRHRTNATFLRPGDRVLTHEGATGEWSHRPGWKRAAARIGSSSGVIGAGELLAPTETTLVAGGVGSVLAVYGGYNVLRAWMTRKHRAQFVKPLHDALAPVVWRHGVAAPAPEQWIHVPVGFQDIGGVEVRVDLPKEFAGGADERQAIVRVIKEKLGLPDPTHQFHLVGDKPYVTLKAAERPPNKVRFAEVAERVMAAKETAPLVAIGARDADVTLDLEADSPHILGAAGSGGGKSVLVKMALMQHLYKGGVAIILDRKRTSHLWARGLSNVVYVTHEQDMHELLIGLFEIVDRRFELIEQHAEDYGGKDNVPVGPRIFLVIEEMNATIKKLANYWKKIKEKEDQNLSPAVEAFQDILFMGREGLCNIFGVAQSGTTNAIGGPEVRENFATRCLTRYTVNAWKMLAPEVMPMPKKSTITGRWQFVASGQASEGQVIFATDAEARQFAVSGTVTPASEIKNVGSEVTNPPSPSQVTHTPTPQGQGDGTVPGAPEPQDGSTEAPRTLYAVSARGDEEAATRGPVGLSEAVSAGIVSVSVDSLRSARKRDDEFPQASGKRGSELLYDPAELARWERNRQRSA